MPTKPSTFLSDATQMSQTSENSVANPQTPLENISLTEFNKLKSNLQNMAFASIFLGVFNFFLILVMLWLTGNQINSTQPSSINSRLSLLENKVDQIIDILPPELRPKINVKVNIPDKNLDRWQGNKEVRYVLIEYADLRCPGCAAMHPEIKAFWSKNQSEVAWVFRHFPGTSGNPNSYRLAQTAECIAKYETEEGFWNFINGVYSQSIKETIQGADQLSTVTTKASEVAKCVEQAETKPKIERDLQDVSQAGIYATPTLVFYDTQKNQFYFIRNLGNADYLQQVFEDFKNKQK
jgi:protein-disulfide isomerase